METVEGSDENKGVDLKKVERLFRRINEMTAAEMRTELKEINISAHGSTKELRFRLHQFYRKEFALLGQRRDETKGRMKNRKRLRYLVAIDIEATCEGERNDVNFPHETIELPAVLVDCSTFTIIDKFRTYIRPEINPRLSDFCINLTHISQADVNEAPLFPEAWEKLMQWMAKHGMMGDDPNASFAIVTDGPMDVHHFLQRSFLQYDIKIPHEFRHFINVKRIFENQGKEFRLTKGDGRTSISKMCEKLGIEMEGAEHDGLSDAINVAKIACHLVVERKIPLFINQRLVRRRNVPLHLPKPADEAEIKAMNDQIAQRGRNENLTSLNAAFVRLPFALKNVSRAEFDTEAYWDGDS